jgi:predicted AAA+ superfamily ATPase
MLLALAAELGAVAIYAACDSPGATLPGFWDRLWHQAEATAAERGRAVVLLDEAHLLPNWAARLKGEWDRLRRRTLSVHVVATGSSALRLAAGSRESLAGRFERLTLTHWSAASVAEVFAIPPRDAAELVVHLGSYPGTLPLREDRARWTAYVRDAIVEPAIGRDLLALGPIRKPALLRQVFGVCVAAPAQVVSLQKIQGQLVERGALETIAHYLALLEEAFLITALPKHARRALRRRAAPPKLVVLNQALLAATDPQGAPEPARDPARFGAWVENACLAHGWNAGQRVAYWREEPLEVDGVPSSSRVASRSIGRSSWATPWDNSRPSEPASRGSAGTTFCCPGRRAKHDHQALGHRRIDRRSRVQVSRGLPDYNERAMDETGGGPGVARCEPRSRAYDFPTIFMMPRYSPVNPGKSVGGQRV